MQTSSTVLSVSLSPFLKLENSMHHHGLILQAERKDILHFTFCTNPKFL